MGHIGWTPQAKHGLGGKTRVQGKSRDQARALLHDALALQEAGAFAMVLELVPDALAAAITQRLRIPTIGIGAGAGYERPGPSSSRTCSAWARSCPRHARPYANLRETILAAATAYADRRGGRHVPRPGADARMDEDVLADVLGQTGADRASTSETPAGGIPLDRDL